MSLWAATRFLSAQTLPSFIQKPRRQIWLPEVRPGENLAAVVFDPPVGRPWATVIFVHGMNVRGAWDPRVVRASESLAQTGVRVITPHFPCIASTRLDHATVPRIAGVIWQCTAYPNLVVGKLGVFSTSFAGAQSLIAVSDPHVGEYVAGVCAVGAYCDARTGLRGLFVDDDAHPYGRMIVFLNFLRLVHRPCGDLEEAFETWIIDEGTGRRPEAPAKIADLSVEDRELWDGIARSRTVRGHLADRILPRIEGALVDLSPGFAVDTIYVPVTLIHGEKDNVIPARESRELHRRLVAAGGRSRLTVTPLISHGDSKTGLAALPDAATLLGAVGGFFSDLR